MVLAVLMASYTAVSTSHSLFHNTLHLQQHYHQGGGEGERRRGKGEEEGRVERREDGEGEATAYHSLTMFTDCSAQKCVLFKSVSEAFSKQ